MMLSIFSYTCWLFVCFLGKMSVQVLCSFLIGLFGTYNTVSLVNSTGLYTLKFVKRVDPVLSVLTTKERNKTQKDTRKLWEVLNMSITLILVVVSWMFAYVQTQEFVYIKYMQSFVYQLYLDKSIIKRVYGLHIPKWFSNISSTCLIFCEWPD